MVTTIQLNENVKKALDRIKSNKETYEDVIVNLMQIVEESKRKQEQLLIEGYKEMAEESLKIAKEWGYLNGRIRQEGEMVEIKRGDIVMANLEPVTGSEQGGVRPF